MFLREMIPPFCVNLTFLLEVEIGSGCSLYLLSACEMNHAKVHTMTHFDDVLLLYSRALITRGT